MKNDWRYSLLRDFTFPYKLFVIILVRKEVVCMIGLMEAPLGWEELACHKCRDLLAHHSWLSRSGDWYILLPFC